ncbi:uncharacterized protein LOC127868852 isoform X2 [Dreissena polymorpha]|uniref:uncharacterized protein LOC127868852 isoform X2 n=1 Tax=Dreissena polymorpha TaxID=45954 RepID=UPI002264E8FA|nr:uncharacterized protein LOC127868852 isoform X2 [Dreissena polymorpha]
MYDHTNRYCRKQITMLYAAVTSIVFVQIFRIAYGESSEDPCLAGNHDNITSMGFRNVTNKDCSQNRVTDYRLVRAWYYAGPDPILTSPPDQLCRCGANFPIWMNGSLPHPQDGIVSRDTCLKYSTNCDTRFGIQVKNCGTFYVYKLPPTREDHTAYCFDCGDPNDKINLDSDVVLGEFRSIEYNSTGVDSHATVNCLKGHGIVDGTATYESFTLTCTSGLKWNSTRTCKSLQGCGDPNIKNNLDSDVVLGEFRSIEYNSTGVDFHATVNCLKGHGIVDGTATYESFTLTCTSGLKWNSTRTCKSLQECGNPNDSKNLDASVKLGHFHNITFTTTSVDSHATVYCSKGNGVQDNGIKQNWFQLTCKDNKWHSTRTCSPQTAALIG